MKLLNKNEEVTKDTTPEHEQRKMQLTCNSLPENPDERKQMIEILKKKRDQILAQRQKK